MSKITFAKTGNFWIDNGIVGLAKVLQNIEVESEADNPINYVLELENAVLTIEVKNDNKSDPHKLSAEIISVLNACKNSVVAKYLKSTGAGWIFRENAFEVYRKTDFKMHLKPFFTGKTPRTEGALCVPDAKDSELGGKGRRMNSEEFDLFQKFKEINSPVVFDERKYALTGKGFLNSAPQYDIGEIFIEDFLKPGKKQCAFSGKKYKHAEVVNGMNFPFLTGKSGEMNFASCLESKPSISSLYSFISLFSFYNLRYQIQADGFKNYFVLYDSSLHELNNFYKAIQMDSAQLKGEDYCNFETSIKGTVFESESLLNFLISVYGQVKQRVGRDLRRQLYTKSVFVLSNDGNIFRDVKEYSSLTSLFDLFTAFEEYDDKNVYNDFINLIRFFTKRIKANDYDTTWRNRLCSDILNFRSIHKTVEWYLADVKLKEHSGNIIFLDKIIEIYNLKTQSQMKTEMVELCKSLGNRIGRYCRENSDKGILFSLRNAKSRAEFINVLAETQFRTQVLYSEDFFKELPDGAQWEEYKSLVSIFAMNSFLYQPENKKIQA